MGVGLENYSWSIFFGEKFRHVENIKPSHLKFWIYKDELRLLKFVFRSLYLSSYYSKTTTFHVITKAFGNSRIPKFIKVLLCKTLETHKLSRVI